MGSSAIQIGPIHGSGGGGDRYTNLNPSTAGAGGIPVGSTFDNEGLNDIMERMFYPYQAPYFTSFAIQGAPTQLEIGDTIAASILFQWGSAYPQNVVLNSISLIDVTNGGQVLASALANDGSHLVTLPGPLSSPVPADHVFRIMGLSTRGQPMQRDVTYSWRYRGFYGGAVTPTLDEDGIESLNMRFPAVGYAGTYAMVSPGYKFICMPDGLGGQINTVTDPGGFTMPMAGAAQGFTHIDGGGFGYQLVPTVNAHGVAVLYRVYRTFNYLGSGTTLTVT